MNSAESAPGGDPADRVEDLHHLVATATQRLLGDTITVADDQWRAPSRLPGWTRGHVATHLARQADALAGVVGGARTGTRVPMYSTPEQRDAEIEAGAARSGLELQIDLDTSAGALAELFEAVAKEKTWDEVVELRHGIQAPVRLLPLARMAEVVLHHVDLDIGMEVDDIDEPTAAWLLEWMTLRLSSRRDFPRLRLQSDSGESRVVGTEGDEVAVRGGSAQLLGWLSGRSEGATLSGAEGITLPPF